jgi:Leucine-rich repeat (LRR) protein
MPAIKRLWLEDNSFTTFPRELLQLRTLELLRLSGCQISELPPGISQLAALKELALDNNPLEVVPPQLCELRQLRKLLLHGCGLADLPEQIGNLELLEQLHVSSNLLRSLPVSIGGCRSLRILSCNNNELSELPLELLRLPLERLNVANNFLRTLHPALARRWQKALPETLVSACCLLETDASTVAVDESGLPPVFKGLTIHLDQNPVTSLTGSETVAGLSVSQAGLSFVEELRNKKKQRPG